MEVAQVRGQDHPNQPPSKTNQLSQKVSDTTVNNVLMTINADAPKDVTTILPTALLEIVHNNWTMKSKATFGGGSLKSLRMIITCQSADRQNCALTGLNQKVALSSMT